MPSQPKMKGDTYAAWRDSVPVTPIPFVFTGDRKFGKIQQTRADIQNKLGRDAVSNAIPFCTAHIVPSTTQVNCINDMIRSEQKCARKFQPPRSKSSMSSSRAILDGPVGNGALGPVGGFSPREPRATSAMSNFSQMSLLQRNLINAQEQDALLSGEGGGRAREGFLKLRKHRPITDRYTAPRTTSHMIGWDAELPDGSFSRPMAPKHEIPADHRKKSAVKSMGRTSGVFGKPEFAY